MEVFVLPLHEDGSPNTAGQGDFINLPIPEEPYVLRFVIYSASSITNQGSLWCNVPQNGEHFDRNQFYEYPINARFDKDTYIDIKVADPGTYCFYTTYFPTLDQYFEGDVRTPFKTLKDEYFGETSLFKDTYMAANIQSDLQSSRKHYFTVSCGFQLNGKPLPLNSLAIETVVSKWMGPYREWPEKLAAIKAKGYNMIHFTPLQKRGDSNSPYAIYDQLDWDPECFPNGKSDVADLVKKLEQKYHILSMTDIVLNHTAHNSDWLRFHPEAGYSVETAPHLLPALTLEDTLTEYSGQLKELGLPSILNNEDDLNAVIEGLSDHVLHKAKLWEFYVVDVKTTMDKIMSIVDDKDRFERLLPTRVPEQLKHNLRGLADYVVAEAGSGFDRFGHERFNRIVDSEYFLSLLKALAQDPQDIKNGGTRLLNEINAKFYEEYDEDAEAIIENLKGRLRFTRIAGDGPKLGEISKKNPLQESYFTKVKAADDGRIVSVVNNGFIWNGDPMIDFASDKSKAYLRRDVISWGDCVKLRYGAKPEDSPWLWEHMTRYTQLLAKYFHGFRIDNCHSTPIHVGEYLLDKARHVRPNLYVAAELFTGSELKDRVFVERLGITSLIREAMQAWSVEELSRLVHKHGGRPIGSFSKQPLIKRGKTGEDTKQIHLVRSAPIHALFTDCTHDNEMAAEKRTVEDTLPTSALVAMCACAVGSNMGYDEGYPHRLNVVNEKRLYTFGGGIGEVKKKLLDVHEQLGIDNASEMYIHHEGQYITVHRVDPKQGTGYFLIARSKFRDEPDQRLNDIVLKGAQASTELAVSLQRTGDPKEDDHFVNGIPAKLVELQHPEISYNEETQITVIKMPDSVPQGSIILLRTWQTSIELGLDKFVREGAREALANVSFLDLNVILYRCDAEERDTSGGRDGVYNIPNYGELTYAGLQGWISPLRDMARTNDMAHPICDNLRAGHWALDYTVQRLYKYQDEFPNIKPYIKWLESRFDRLRTIPSHLTPRYFALVVFHAYSASLDRALSLMPEGIEHGTSFLQQLALTSIQMLAKVPSTSIFPKKNVGSMAAGLPHFSHDYMRCWGRDVFMSLRGLLMVLGRYDEAKQHILAFAATLKHGLIPNLLDAGRTPRYNARDATWFFVEQVQAYCLHAPNGIKLLDEKVKRRFPLDDTYVTLDDERAFSEESTIREIVYEILSRHAKGIKFREANAGPNLDSQMRDEGFNQEIHVDWNNGMIFGGNQWNCGTWMDKMGESDKAGNKGVPGTPRDGAAIEITGLLKSALRWVNQLHKEGQFEWDHVINQKGQKVLLTEWERKLQRSFEKCYYVPVNPHKDVLHDINPNIVHQRGIYKDVYRSGKEYEDYQLRPNFSIAMVVAPELFDLDHAWGAIGIADKLIRGPVGMRTLDPEDLNYRPYYINGLETDDFATSKGRNYHQGPEWVWCLGYFLRAMLLFDIMRKKNYGGDLTETFQQLHKRMIGVNEWLHKSPWAGLTELTNKDGELCNDSSPTQAWSSALLIELFEDARLFGEPATSGAPAVRPRS